MDKHVIKSVCEAVCSNCPTLQERGMNSTNCAAICNLDLAMHILMPVMDGADMGKATREAIARREEAIRQLNRCHDVGKYGLPSCELKMEDL